MKNSENFPQTDVQKAMALAQTDTAKQLFALLQASNLPRLQNAGDLSGASALLAQLMADPEARALLEKLKGEANG